MTGLAAASEKAAGEEETEIDESQMEIHEQKGRDRQVPRGIHLGVGWVSGLWAVEREEYRSSSGPPAEM